MGEGARWEQGKPEDTGGPRQRNLPRFGALGDCWALCALSF